ncbi:MAG: 23S rRNA (guanosine(2251)-2'-O)-methyltransferase RlmB [Eubacteriales bacterium]|nr:23S rRNA (guanosine(2251)-2'-O)-methyltransferase RlmB [Eubacteriales bacterium]MDD3349549.1 23S rRNA (guanosine(2251)-2'-O)-methyltransferase RlmB [Eubacteriales bacterium]
MDQVIYGRNPVMEALKSGREIEKLLILKNGEGSIKKIEGLARERRIAIQYVDKAALDRVAGGDEGSVSHQGVAAYTSANRYYEVEDLLEAAAKKGEAPFLILLDGIEDPHNLGAILRTADGAGAHGVIIPKRRAAGLTDTVAKASAGAIEYVPTAKVSNLAQTIDQLKEKGLWIAACDMGGTVYHKTDLTGPIAIVIGGEGQGVGRLIREKCDYVISIPMRGKISSLNASNAAAVLLYEIDRQRSISKK